MPKRCAAQRSPSTLTQDEKRISLPAQGLLQGMQKLSPYLDELSDRENHGQRDDFVLPSELYDKLAMLLTISHLGIPAQNAQRVHGVPASFLIADHITHYTWHQVPPSSEECERFAGERHFLNEARSLATNRKFRPALKLAGSPVAYARRLHELGFFDTDLCLLDAIGRIVDYSLFELDWRYAAIKPPHEVTIDQAAEFLSQTPESVRAQLDSGEIDALSWGNKVLYRDLFAYRERRLVRQIQTEVRAAGPATERRHKPHQMKTDATEASNLVMFHVPAPRDLDAEIKSYGKLLSSASTTKDRGYIMDKVCDVLLDAGIPVGDLIAPPPQY